MSIHEKEDNLIQKFESKNKTSTKEEAPANLEDIKDFLDWMEEESRKIIENANERIESSKEMGASEEDISKLMENLSPIQKQIVDLCAEYRTKIEDIGNIYSSESSRIKESAISALEKVKGVQAKKKEKIDSENELAANMAPKALNLLSERKKEKIQEKNAKEKEELLKKIESFGDPAEMEQKLVDVKKNINEIQNLLKTNDEAVDEMRDDLENELKDHKQEVVELEEKISEYTKVKKALDTIEGTEAKILKEEKIDKLLVEKQEVVDQFEKINSIEELPLEVPEGLLKDDYIELAAGSFFKKERANKKNENDIKNFDLNKDKYIENIKAKAELQFFKEENKEDLKVINFYEARDDFQNNNKQNLYILNEEPNLVVVAGQYEKENFWSSINLSKQKKTLEDEILILKKELDTKNSTWLGKLKKHDDLEIKIKEEAKNKIEGELNTKKIRMKITNEQKSSLHSLYKSLIDFKNNKKVDFINPVNDIDLYKVLRNLQYQDMKEITDVDKVTGKVSDVFDFLSQGGPTKEQIEIQEKYRELLSKISPK